MPLMGGMVVGMDVGRWKLLKYGRGIISPAVVGVLSKKSSPSPFKQCLFHSGHSAQKKKIHIL